MNIDTIGEDLRQEMIRAVKLHPVFPQGQAAVSIIAEELGELAKELNDMQDGVPGALDRAYHEAMHVTVTAYRELIELAEEKERRER